MNTLITAASSARAHQLKSKITLDSVILGDYRDLPDVLLKSGKLVRLPNPRSVSYAHEMLTLCLDMQINIVYALSNEEQIPLTEAKQLFTEYDIKIITDFLQ